MATTRSGTVSVLAAPLAAAVFLCGHSGILRWGNEFIYDPRMPTKRLGVGRSNHERQLVEQIRAEDYTFWESPVPASLRRVSVPAVLPSILSSEAFLKEKAYAGCCESRDTFVWLEESFLASPSHKPRRGNWK